MRVGIGYGAHPGGAGMEPLAALCEVLRQALLGAAGMSEETAAAVEPAAGATGADAPEPGRALGRLVEAVERLERENYQVVNADAVLSADGPETGFEPAAARLRIAEVLHVPPSALSLRSAAAGGLPGPPGSGVAALAVALLDRMEEGEALPAALRFGT